MVTEEDKENKELFGYTYKLEKGISNVHGGMKVLRDMNYPKEIIESQA
jgi:DNA mismatch repair ATPase MutS